MREGGALCCGKIGEGVFGCVFCSSFCFCSAQSVRKKRRPNRPVKTESGEDLENRIPKRKSAFLICISHSDDGMLLANQRERLTDPPRNNKISLLCLTPLFFSSRQDRQLITHSHHQVSTRPTLSVPTPSPCSLFCSHCSD